MKCHSEYTFSLFQAHSDDSQHSLILLVIILSYTSIDSKTCDPHILNSLEMKKVRSDRTALFHSKCSWNWNWINSENAMQRILRYHSRRRCCCFLWDNFIICYNALFYFRTNEGIYYAMLLSLALWFVRFIIVWIDGEFRLVLFLVCTVCMIREWLTTMTMLLSLLLS